MKKIKLSILPAAAMIIFSLCLSCNSSTETENNPICFSVDGSYVTVRNLWEGIGSEQFDFSGGAGWISRTVYREGGEEHSLYFTNIVRSNIGDVLSFDATIDGVSYSYPEDSCD